VVTWRALAAAGLAVKNQRQSDFKFLGLPLMEVGQKFTNQT